MSPLDRALVFIATFSGVVAEGLHFFPATETTKVAGLIFTALAVASAAAGPQLRKRLPPE